MTVLERCVKFYGGKPRVYKKDRYWYSSYLGFVGHSHTPYGSYIMLEKLFERNFISLSIGE